jgi:hypothetical protein
LKHLPRSARSTIASVSATRLRRAVVLGLLAVPGLLGAYACGGPEADVLRFVAAPDADASDRDSAAPAPADASDASDASDERDASVATDAGDANDACVGADLSTDPAHCGACFHSCLGGPCDDGRCGPVLVTTAESPAGIAVDGQRVFFAQSIADGGVFSVATNGADPQTLVTGLSFPQRVHVSGAFVLYSAVGTPGVVGRVDKGGGLARTLAKTNASPSEIAVDGSQVFFVDQYAGAVRVMPFDGMPDAGIPPAFVSGVVYGWGLAVAGNDVVWSERGTFVPRDGGSGDFTAADGTVRAAPKDGSGSPRILASDQAEPLGVAADATGIYWVAAKSGELMQLASGSSVPRVVASNLPSPWGLTLDDKYLYITCVGFAEGQGIVARVKKNEASPAVEVLAHDLASPSTVAADDVAIYWTNTHGGTLMKVAK